MTRHRLLAAVYWTAFGAFVLPLGLILLTSLAQGEIVGFPLGPLGWHWYRVALSDPDYRRAFALSVVLALASAGLAVIVGTWIGLAAASLRSRWAELALMAAALLPLVTPGVIHAVALRIAIQMIGLEPGVGAILLGHAIHATPYAAIMVRARRATLPAEQVEAAHVFGAGSFAMMIHVVWPWLRPALFGAGGLAALTSFDDFIRSFFLGGYDPTLPVLIFARLRSGLTPEINAVSTLVLVVMGLACALATRARSPWRGHAHE
jgi:spermidine/putrescine transport system permease protein